MAVEALQINKLPLMPFITVLQLSPIRLLKTQTQIVVALKSLPIIRIRFPVLWNRHTKISSLVLNVTVKGKTWTGPEGSRKMRLPDFKTVGT